MRLKTILNRVQRHPSFVYERVRMVEGDVPRLEVDVRARTNSRPCCSGCGRAGPGYDTLAPRRFEFVPFWGIAVFLVYAMRRVDCGGCGVRVERVPWATGKHTLTTTYAWFLASWARRLSWKEVAEVFRTSWDKVFAAVEMAVAVAVEDLRHRARSRQHLIPKPLSAQPLDGFPGGQPGEGERRTEGRVLLGMLLRQRPQRTGHLGVLLLPQLVAGES